MSTKAKSKTNPKADKYPTNVLFPSPPHLKCKQNLKWFACRYLECKQTRTGWQLVSQRPKLYQRVHHMLEMSMIYEKSKEKKNVGFDSYICLIKFRAYCLKYATRSICFSHFKNILKAKYENNFPTNTSHVRESDLTDFKMQF